MTIRTSLRAARATTASALACAPLLLAPATARAQELVKVENAVREQLPAPQFVAAAYGFIWLAILTYVVVVARGLARTRRDIDELRRRVERASGGDKRT